MSPETIERIFEPFFTTKNPGEGTGLGLAMVHGIIDSHDGAIRIDSEPGLGTTFHLYFPVHRSNDELIESNAVQDRQGNGQRILFLDDEELLTELGKEALEILGYSVTSCSNPHEAWQLIQTATYHFDLIITDQTMPGMTGLELSKKILMDIPDQKIVICTGYCPNLTPSIAREAGVLEIIQKPISITKLSTVVNSALAQSDGSHANTSKS